MTSGGSEEPLAQAEFYLDLLFGRMPPDVWVVPFSAPAEQSRCARPSELAQVARWALERSEAGQQVYVAMGVQPHAVEASRRGLQKDVVAIPGFWWDVDLQAPPGVHKATNLPATYDEAFAACIAPLVAEGLPLPTLVIDSGYGAHVYWLFAEPWAFKDRAEQQRARAAEQLLQKRLQANAKRHGWHTDMTANLERLLRIPGTLNRKADGQQRLARILSCDPSRRVTVEDVERLKRPVGRPAKAPSVAGNAAVSLPAAAVGTLRFALGQYSGGDGEGRLERVQRIRALLAGESFADAGERDEWMQRLVSIVAFVDQGRTDDDEVVALFVPSLASWVAEPGATKSLDEELGKVREKLDRARADAAAQAASAASERATARDVLRAIFDRAHPDEAPRAVASGGENDDGLFDDEDIARWAREQGCTPAAWRHRWLLQKGDAHWIWDGTTYRAPVQAKELIARLRDDWHYALGKLVFLTVPKADGKGERTLKPPEVVERYGTVVRHVIANLVLQRSVFDGLVFHEAVCPRLLLEPAYDPEVDAWMRALFGMMVEYGLDWVAAVTLLERACACLYLDGSPGSGKSLFAVGLAQLWGEAPTEFSKVVGTNFNQGLAQCPLVFGDEQSSVDRGRVNLADAFRTFVGSQRRILSRKFLHDIPLVGNCRLILAANNDRALEFGDVDLGPDDLDAIRQRVLYVKIPKDPDGKSGPAVHYLKSIGGAAKVARWIAERTIARHALWLAANRTLQNTTSRFVVEGIDNEMQQQLGTRTRPGAAAAEWLLRYLEKPVESVVREGLVRAGGGRLFVTTRALVHYWSSLSTHPAPTGMRVARALDTLSVGRVTLASKMNCKPSTRPAQGDPGVEFFEIAVDRLLGYAQQNQVVDLSKVLDTIYR